MLACPNKKIGLDHLHDTAIARNREIRDPRVGAGLLLRPRAQAAVRWRTSGLMSQRQRGRRSVDERNGGRRGMERRCDGCKNWPGELRGTSARSGNAPAIAPLPLLWWRSSAPLAPSPTGARRVILAALLGQQERPPLYDIVGGRLGRAFRAPAPIVTVRATPTSVVHRWRNWKIQGFSRNLRVLRLVMLVL